MLYKAERVKKIDSNFERGSTMKKILSNKHHMIHKKRLMKGCDKLHCGLV